MKTTRTIPSEQLEKENLQLRNEVAFLNEQLEWFKRQIFGQRSERIANKPDEYQLMFEGFENLQTETKEKEKTVAAHTRRKAKPQWAGCDFDS